MRYNLRTVLTCELIIDTYISLITFNYRISGIINSGTNCRRGSGKPILYVRKTEQEKHPVVEFLLLSLFYVLHLSALLLLFVL